MTVEQSELDDAYAEIRRLGHNESDFMFTRTPFRSISTGVAPVVADMLVMNTVNGRQKTYDAGHGSSWPAEFSRDLATGYFSDRAD